MKKSLILITLLIYSVTSYAQIEISGRAGLNLSKYSNDEAAKIIPGYKIGGGIQYSFDEMWALQTSLYLSAKGARTEDKEAAYTTRQTYLELPIMAALKMELTDITTITFSAGPYMAYGIGGKVEKKDYTTKEITYRNSFDEQKLKRFDTGLGCSFNLGINRILLSMDFMFGFLKIKKDTRQRNLSSSICIGYKF